MLAGPSHEEANDGQRAEERRRRDPERDRHGYSARPWGGRDGNRPARQHLRGRGWQAGPRPGRGHDHGFRVRDLLDHQGDHGTACLQLVEEGRLDLDAPAETYAPEIGKAQVLEGFDADGKPRLRAPKRAVTTRMLLLHTAGFGYDFFNERYNRLAKEHGQPSVITSSKAALRSPLLFDPGEDWEYGSNIDWAGQVIEGVTGKRLGEVMQERIFAPLGMASSAFTLSPDMRGRLAAMHQREADGSLKPMPDFELPQEPEVHMGGHGLYATVGDYCRFIRMWLNDGAGEHGRVLKPETVHMAVQNGLGDKKVKLLPGVIASLSNDAEFFPGLSKSWALTFMINDEPAPTGRPAGASAGPGSPTSSTGSTARTASAASGPPRSSPSPTRPRSAATWTSKPRF